MSEPEPQQQPGSSQRQILRATSISGGAAIVNILTSVLRVKALALLVGPAGVGLMGLFQRVLSLAGTLAGLGLAQSGARHIAAVSEDPLETMRVRRALFIASVALGLVGWLVLWVAREPIARAVFDDAKHASEIGWLGLGVVLNGITTSQTALLQGLRRIGDLALVSMLGGLLGAVVGVAVIWQLGLDGVVWMLLATPLMGALVALRYTRRLPRPTSPPRMSLPDLTIRWRALATMGAAVLIANTVATLVQLQVRSMVLDELGLDASGHFESAWQVSMLYIGFVLAAMGTDYFPRLTTLTHDTKASNRLVNDQAEIALLLAAPVLIGLVGLAPAVIHILYSSRFDPAAELLQLHALGDALKLLSWPVAYIFLARGANRVYLAGELLWSVVYLPIIAALLPTVGLMATAWAYIAAYLVYLTYGLLFTRRLTGLVLERRVSAMALGVALVALALVAAHRLDGVLGHVLGALASLLVGYFALDRLVRLVAPGGRLGRLLGRLGLGR